jgi:cytidylate kinase
VRSKPIVAIDGPAGSGKSTVAKELARQTGFLYLDTGAMYRAVTLKLLRSCVDHSDEHKISEVAISSSIRLDSSGERIFLDNEDVTRQIRSPEVDREISDYVKVPGFRRSIVKQQRAYGVDGGIVVEGRDIGTVVFPDAEIKIYLDASPQVRAERRWRELRDRGIELDLNEIKRDIIERDRKDSTRRDSPLRASEDAILIDTSDMTIEQVVHKIMTLLGDLELHQGAKTW